MKQIASGRLLYINNTGSPDWHSVTTWRGGMGGRGGRGWTAIIIYHDIWSRSTSLGYLCLIYSSFPLAICSIQDNANATFSVLIHLLNKSLYPLLIIYIHTHTHTQIHREHNGSCQRWGLGNKQNVYR